MEEEDEGGQYDDDEDQVSEADDVEQEEAVVVEEVEATESEDEAEVVTDGIQIELKVAKYDEPLVASPLTNLYASLGVMLLARKVDLFHPTVVRIARFAFISYLILLQLFLFYVRIQAKRINDRTPIELKNPLSSMLQSQLGGSEDGGNNMMKNLASSFLSSKSTILEYDLKQARGMQSGLIFNMLLMWFLHFKMEQVQPLLIQTANGLITMVYSPLFQVYILGRNLERPFKSPAMKKIEGAQESETEDSDSAETTPVDEEEEGDEDAESDAGNEDGGESDEETATVTVDVVDGEDVEAVDEGDADDDGNYDE
jgi:Phosphate transport (Pho88)